MLKKKRPPLTRKREQWAEQRGGHLFEGKPLHYPAAPAARYQAALQALVKPMLDDYERELKRVFEQHDDITQDASIASQARIGLSRLSRRWFDRFRKKGPDIVSRIFGQIDKAASASLHRSLKEVSGGLSLKTKTMPKALQEALKISTANNVELIKSIPQQFHRQIEGIVTRSIQPGGNGLQDVTEGLRKYDGITKRRADFIAIDQTRKITTAINSERAKAAGIKKFKWLHSGGGVEPRQLHLKLSGKVFNYDDLPLIDQRTKERGLPGQLPNCRCVAIPVIDFGD